MIVRSLLIAALGIALTTGHPAHAQTQSYETLIEEAVSEYTRGNFQEARALFQLAHDKQPNARTFRGLGIVEYELRDYVNAIVHFEAALADTRNKISKEQRAEVEKLLERARRFIGKFVPRVEPASAELRIDGRPVALTGDKLPLNPGEYQLTARADGYKEEARKLLVRGGEDTALVFVLEPASAAAGEATAEPDEPVLASDEARAASASSGPPLVSIVAFAVGGVGLATFAIAGSMGIAKDSELQECSPSCAEAEIEAQETQLLVADIGLVVGIVGAGAGALLWALDGREERGEERTQPTARIEPWLSPNLAGARAAVRF